MADNVSITAGSGTTIAADDVGGVQYQIVKLDMGGDGLSAPLSASDPLPVNVAATEDAVAASGHKGVPIFAVRQDSQSALAGDGDFINPTVDANGGLRVSIVAGAGSGGTAMSDDAVFTPGATSVTPAAGTYRSSRDSVDDNDAGAFAMTIKRALYTCLETPLGDSAMDDSLDAVKVSIVGDSVGSTVDADNNAVVVGNVAHDGADTRAPVKIGAKASTALSGLTLVADGDRTDLFAGVDGALITRPHCNLEAIVSGNASNTDGTSTQVIAAQAAGIKTYLTTIILTNMHASTDAYVEIKDGTSVKLTIPVPHASGAVVNLPVPLPGTAATAWNFDPSAAVTTLYCSMIGFKSKV